MKHKYIKHIKEIDNISMQDINTREIERAIANTGDLFRGSSTLTLCPAFNIMEDFH